MLADVIAAARPRLCRDAAPRIIYADGLFCATMIFATMRQRCLPCDRFDAATLSERAAPCRERC